MNRTTLVKKCVGLHCGIVLTFAFLLISLTNGQSPAPTNHTEISEFVVKRRLAELNQSTTIELTYNAHVQAYIDVYTKKRRDHLSIILGRAELYFPLFEKYLDKYNLPLELKYLAVVESALDPRAKSTSGAMGLWQFLYDASQMFNMDVSTYIDERCDPEKSTEAACQYLEYLYRNFNNWHLALASYNVGIGEVKKAIARSGGKTDFWELRPYLPPAAQSYVPAFIAVNYVMNSYKLYGVNVKPLLLTMYDIDSVMVNKPLRFEQIASAIGVSIEDISFLNPMYTKNYIPANGKLLPLYLPANKISIFLNEVKKIPESNKPQFIYSSVTGRDVEQIVHEVKRGEYFHAIAIRYRCRIEDIMSWNKLKTKDLSAGQRLVIYKFSPYLRFFFVENELDDKLYFSLNTPSECISANIPQ